MVYTRQKSHEVTNTRGFIITFHTLIVGTKCQNENLVLQANRRDLIAVAPETCEADNGAQG
jgi:hypothetical protein